MINWLKNNRNKIAGIALIIIGLIDLLYAFGYKYNYYQPTSSDILTNMLGLSFILIIVGYMGIKDN
jgi:hypothetical protein